MLHAAAMLAGLFVLALLHTQLWGPGAWAVSFAMALVCVVVAARFGGIASNAFAATPQVLLLRASRVPAMLRGAISVLRASIAADVTLHPALVRVRTNRVGGLAKAALADAISLAPGSIVVHSDAEALLVHVTAEDSADVAALSSIEADASALLERRRPE